MADAGSQAPRRINLLLDDIVRNGNEDLGKPDPLRHEYQGYWSRRINEQHRLIYRITPEDVLIAACRHHLR